MDLIIEAYLIKMLLIIIFVMICAIVVSVLVFKMGKRECDIYHEEVLRLESELGATRDRLAKAFSHNVELRNELYKIDKSCEV